MPLGLGDLRVPQSVAALAADPAWTVTWSATLHRWLTAERECTVQRRGYRIGLTPVDEHRVALIVWEGDRVVHHARHTEQTACRAAHDFTQRSDSTC
ncbi:hypothetical protein ACWEOE_26840 [Amycolatopsis sp. NPDC004368]